MLWIRMTRYISVPVHDFPHSRLEFSIRVSVRTGRRHEVPREETQGLCFWCVMLNVSWIMCSLKTIALQKHMNAAEPNWSTSKTWSVWSCLRCRSQRISTKSCRMYVNTSTPASPTSPVSWCLTPASKWPPTHTLMEELKVHFLCQMTVSAQRCSVFQSNIFWPQVIVEVRF